jgi:membrane protein
VQNELTPDATITHQGHDWRAEVGASKNSDRSVDLVRSREPGRGREANTPEQIPPRGWRDILWRVFWSISADRILSTSGGVAFFALLAVFPGIAAIISMYGLFADVSRIGEHLSVLTGLFPGGVLDLIADQITLISRKGNQTLGMAFVAGLLISLGSANSGMAALFDALNVVYDEREKRSLVRLYATTFLFTLAGIVIVIVAITGVVVLPVMLKFVGLSTTTEWLLAILRWPVLLVTVVVGLTCIYRYGPSRRDARWRWVTWGSILAALLWMASSMLFSWYVATFDSYNKIYGSLGAGVGFMVWLQTARDTTEGGSKPLGSRGAMMADHVGEAQK